MPRFAPVRWQPPPAPPRARQRTSAEPFPPYDLIPLPGNGPEDVVVGADGMLYAGVADGRILRVDPRTYAVTSVADTRGRPLGLEPLQDGRLVVCDSHRGLLRVDPRDGGVEVLVAEVGTPLVFCSNAVAADDGTIWFTESSRRYHVEEYRSDLLEHSCTGRLMRRDRDGAVEVLLDGLAFANGLALAADGASLVVAETAAYRLGRYHLTGPEQGTYEPLAENLPGFPDNISRAPDGDVWVALANPRDPRLDLLLPRAPWLRRLVNALPERLATATRTCWVVRVDAEGNVVRDLQTTGERFAFATGLVEHDGRLYVGSLVDAAIAVVDLTA